ncbi:tetratricopeptide repeat protein [Streptomyces sp. NPDC047315]|uniref:ATP-binding protein n=1 Tax=Streptomyces sp. NPDC047315 TaxID=3155142 RepID=UPI0034024D23
MTEPREVVDSTLSGTARDVVQARDVRGGIHYHHAPAAPAVRGPVPCQLPMASQGFVNRHTEREALDRLLDDGRAGVRVLLVTGTAGVGKTSLALHWAHAVRERFPDGQLYADLHGYGPQAPVAYERVLEGFLRALGASADAVHTDGEHMAAAFRSCLVGRRLLIVLDNAVGASQVRPLLPATPDCLVVVTSRRRLSGLAIREGARRLKLDVLDQDDSVALLRSVTSGYRDGDETAHVAELASLCARLPLALRVAAERAAGRPLMRLVDLIDELRDESGRWEVLSAEDHEESEAVRPVFAWSYRDLPPGAARLFRLLGLHPGPDFSDTAAAALAGVDVRTARRLLDVVTTAHMVEQTASDRFGLHDLLRAYAADQARLEETALERQEALGRVLTWYLHTADAVQAMVAPQEPRVDLVPADDGLPEVSFVDAAAAMGWYEAERDNLVAAVRAAASGGSDRIAWQLAVVLRAVYMTNNPFQDWLTTSQLGLQAARRDGDRAAEAELLESLGMAHAQSQSLAAAAEHYESALALRRELHDAFGEALTLNGLGLLELRRRNLAQARTALEGSRRLFADSGDGFWEPRVAVNLAQMELELGRPADAFGPLRRGVEVFRAHGDRRAEGNALRLLAAAELDVGDVESALAHAEQAVVIATEIRSEAAEGYWLLALGDARRAIGRPADALASYQRAVTLQEQLGDRVRQAAARDGLGHTHLQLGHVQEAVECHRRAVDTYRELGQTWETARALAHLADALERADAAREAADARAEACELLAQFDDPRAVGLREGLRGR